MSEGRKRFYLVWSQLDPHTKMLSFCDNKYFPSVFFQWSSLHPSHYATISLVRSLCLHPCLPPSLPLSTHPTMPTPLVRSMSRLHPCLVPCRLEHNFSPQPFRPFSAYDFAPPVALLNLSGTSLHCYVYSLSEFRMRYLWDTNQGRCFELGMTSLTGSWSSSLELPKLTASSFLCQCLLKEISHRCRE